MAEENMGSIRVALVIIHFYGIYIVRLGINDKRHFNKDSALNPIISQITDFIEHASLIHVLSYFFFSRKYNRLIVIIRFLCYYDLSFI